MELLVGVGIVAVLVGIVFKGVPYLRDRAEGVRCVTNMRSLQVSLAAYVQDKGHWPQEPEEIWNSDNLEAYEDWWLNELEPYGAPEDVWQCPTVKRLVVAKTKDGRPKTTLYSHDVRREPLYSLQVEQPTLVDRDWEHARARGVDLFSRRFDQSDERCRQAVARNSLRVE